jgi:protein SCO1
VRTRTRALLFPITAALIFPIGCANRVSRLPNYGTVPSFKMTDSEGHDFDSKVLRGKVWIVDFIYTSCPGPCPTMTSQMRKLQEQVSGEDDVRLVSISVDPQHDSARALNDFAHRFGGPTDNWTFLTGSPETIHRLAYEVFHVGDLIGNMDHSTKFVLVDKRGNIRGYCSSLGTEDIAATLKDVAALRKENS